MSKPAWSNTFGCSTTPVFFSLSTARDGRRQQGRNHMNQSSPTMAQQLAQAARECAHQRTGHAPQSATAVLSDDTLVITLREALSPAEKALALSPAGAAQLQEYH